MTTQETALTTLDSAFDGENDESAIRPVLSEHPRLQWFNGLSTTTRETAVGWHVEAEVNPRCDDAAAAAGLRRYIVQHKTTGTDGQPKQLPYWALNLNDGEPPAFFVVTYGLQSKQQMNRKPERLGIAYGWETVRKDGNIVYKTGPNNKVEPKKQCRLQFRTFVQLLVEHGFDEWMAGGVNGYLTESFLDACNQQFLVLEEFRKQMKRPMPPFYGFSLSLVPGEVKMVGPEKGDKSPIYPIKAKLPQVIDRIYFDQHLISAPLLAKIRDGLLEETMLWSEERSAVINEGDQNQEDEFTVDDALTVDGSVAQASVPVARDPNSVVTMDEWRWIVQGFCGSDPTYLQQLCTRFNVTDAKQLLFHQYQELQQEIAAFAAQQRPAQA